MKVDFSRLIVLSVVAISAFPTLLTAMMMSESEQVTEGALASSNEMYRVRSHIVASDNEGYNIEVYSSGNVRIETQGMQDGWSPATIYRYRSPLWIRFKEKTHRLEVSSQTYRFATSGNGNVRTYDAVPIVDPLLNFTDRLLPQYTRNYDNLTKGEPVVVAIPSMRLGEVTSEAEVSFVLKEVIQSQYGTFHRVGATLTMLTEALSQSNGDEVSVVGEGEFILSEDGHHLIGFHQDLQTTVYSSTGAKVANVKLRQAIEHADIRFRHLFQSDALGDRVPFQTSHAHESDGSTAWTLLRTNSAGHAIDGEPSIDVLLAMMSSSESIGWGFGGVVMGGLATVAGGTMVALGATLAATGVGTPVGVGLLAAGGFTMGTGLGMIIESWQTDTIGAVNDAFDAADAALAEGLSPTGAAVGPPIDTGDQATATEAAGAPSEAAGGWGAGEWLILGGLAGGAAWLVAEEGSSSGSSSGGGGTGGSSGGGSTPSDTGDIGWLTGTWSAETTAPSGADCVCSASGTVTFSPNGTFSDTMINACGDPASTNSGTWNYSNGILSVTYDDGGDSWSGPVTSGTNQFTVTGLTCTVIAGGQTDVWDVTTVLTKQ